MLGPVYHCDSGGCIFPGATSSSLDTPGSLVAVSPHLILETVRLFGLAERLLPASPPAR